MTTDIQADVAVRPARPGDEADIARIQVAAWVAALGERLGPRRHSAFDAEAIEAGWQAAITEPPTTGHRVFVATQDGAVVGFAAVSPPQDLIALEVAPDRRRRGHGSRLLAASADHIREHGGTTMRIWALEKDAIRNRYLRDAGFAEAGMRRELDGPGITIPEQLWHTSLED
jgi:ribosomal protein S18 acetylase RimI-like enzyme